MFNTFLPKSHTLLEIFGIIFIILISFGVRTIYCYLYKKYKLEHKDGKIEVLLGLFSVLFVLYSCMVIISFNSNLEKMSCIKNNSSKIEKLQKEEDYSLEDSIFEVCVGEQPDRPDYEYDLRGRNYY